MFWVGYAGIFMRKIFFEGNRFENCYFQGILKGTFCLHVGNSQIESDESAVKTKENFGLRAFQRIWAFFRTPTDRRDRFRLDVISNLPFLILEQKSI